ncbi:MAG TPA: hypothetical protein VN228_11430 [Pyrinomonadaceae bacterium]|nr:hypothetical protein [Pyrinomonadaceae bacterium]
MRNTLREEAKVETRALGVIALLCYSTTLAAMFALGYSALALALQAAGRDLTTLFPAAGV